MSNSIKKLLKVKSAPKSRSMGPHVRQVIPSGLQDADPFVFLDHFGPFLKLPNSDGVPPHPHAGIATITYLFEGKNLHRDSLGNEAMVNAGDLAWMQAGKGIIHAEGMGGLEESQNIHGLQFWISLPAKDKFADPYFKHYSAETMPTLTLEHATVKVILGKIGDAQSPVNSLSPAYIFEVKADANALLNISTGEGTSAAVYTISGQVDTQGQSILPAAIAGFDRNGDTVQLQAGKDGAHFMVLGGLPLDEPIVAYASFVMNSFDQINKVIQDYSNGRMGHLD
jgi:redox-sensitive bicupin YhaK (pirin superfamily)